MSTEIGSVKTYHGPMAVTRFWGGDGKGQCVQLTQGPGSILGQGKVGHIQLTADDCERVIEMLRQFVDSVRCPAVVPIVHLLTYSCGCSYPWGGGKDCYHDYHCATCRRELWSQAS